jgi:hypothetical protein
MILQMTEDNSGLTFPDGVCYNLDPITEAITKNKYRISK